MGHNLLRRDSVAPSWTGWEDKGGLGDQEEIAFVAADALGGGGFFAGGPSNDLLE